MDEGIQVLTEMFKDRQWFHSVGFDQYGRYVVYTNFMCHETLHEVPDRVNNKQVLVHFAASLTATANQFTDNQTKKPVLELIPDEPESLEELTADDLELDLDDLCKELDRLEKKCGSEILQHIFYEIHDGRNALTNHSGRFPEVADSMKDLYKRYGFDTIYEELDG